MRLQEFLSENQIKPGAKVPFILDIASVPRSVQNQAKQIEQECQTITQDISKARSTLNYVTQNASQVADPGTKIQELNSQILEKENRLRYLQQDFQELASACTNRIYTELTKTCGEFLSVTRTFGGCLYRGSSNFLNPHRSSAFIGTAHAQRHPTDTVPEIHKFVNHALKSNGFSATRGNSIMCTSDLGMAYYYASGVSKNTYIIVPFDGFEYTWSHKYKDLWASLLSRTPAQTVASFKEFISSLQPGTENIEKRLIEYAEFDDKNLEQALESEHEIYIKGKYYAFSYEYYRPLIDLIRGR
jgi:hypothetical protein